MPQTETQRLWYLRNKEERARQRALRREENRNYAAEYRLANPNTLRVWRKRNRAKVRAWVNAASSERRSATARRVPWFNKEQVGAMYQLAQIYRDAGFDCHVDHIVPLKHRLVCGLHVQNNLAVVPAKDNLSKGNRTWPDMPDRVSQRQLSCQEN